MNRKTIMSYVGQTTGILLLTAMIASTPPSKASETSVSTRPARSLWTPVQPSDLQPAMLKSANAQPMRLMEQL